jgi:hypothetical protein
MGINSIIVESVDRLGKDTLIKGIKDRLGYFHTIHYQKPELLEYYLKEARFQFNKPDDYIDLDIKRYAQRSYQQRSFVDMFGLLSSGNRYLMNRAHLGEFVYSPRYREYDGSYVFDLEERFIKDHGSKFHQTTLLVLLTSSDFAFITDDGLSFDWDAKEEEQNDFIRAFEKSNIVNKLMIDVNDGAGCFVPKDLILDTVLYAIAELPKQNHHVMNVNWDRNNVQDQLTRHAEITPDPRNIVFTS